MLKKKFKKTKICIYIYINIKRKVIKLYIYILYYIN